MLTAVGTGLWRWENSSGTVTVDRRAAALLGMADGAGTVPATAVRACLAPEDMVDLTAAVDLGLAEERVAEARLRVIGEDGRVVRRLHTRLHGEPHPSGGAHTVVGTLAELPEDGALHQVSDGGRRAREAFLLDAGRALAEADSTAEVLRVAASLSMPGFTPDGQAIFAVQGDQLVMIGHHGHRHGGERPFLQMPLATDYPAAEVARTGRAIYLPAPEAYRDRFPATWPLVEPLGRRSWAFLPLVVAGSTTGAWLAAFREPVRFTPDERSVLTTVARMLAQALTRAHLQESERELSDGLQRTMLPTHKPEIAGMTLAARYVPTGGGLQIGGDWYDVIDLPSGRTALVIGDVQGHDVRAAGLMGQLRIALRAYASEGHRPDAVLSRASRFLAGLNDAADAPRPAGAEVAGGRPHGFGDRFATCLYVEVDPATGNLDIARAGHPDPAIRLGDGTTIVRHTPGGLPLGIDPDADYPTTTLALDPGEVLLVCTDGLIETGGHDLDTGWRRLTDVLAATPADDLETLADALVAAVHGPPSHHTPGPLADRREDDVALLLLRCGEARAELAYPPRRTALTVGQDQPQAIRGARHEIRALMHDWADPDQVDSAVLMVSEMLTNVLVHTDGDAGVTAEVLGRPGSRRLRVTVADRSDEMPHRRSPGEMASSGRGLILLDELSDASGVDPAGQGKSIWFELYEADAPGTPH
ncbi:magnesium or manganese-dependent protein phosphatase [Streptantibioticus cattleyicolor NRRL 8057 = DSM 46488]|uniref:protein-serine/threonine phosphatase n=1 Tax=Streptantibioticus cattleyicolor (strain ATCC 35852 / DSM 46488 / JCM 4925 / NBRC 14057 / NRRL 8057) TaxID=1003195 RepID=G8WU96_STREN|nr:magnesium or manganese-dependent protein phosphatase [Streptantibioticus cattleyicolor NRRL 8057 = DSM 46488]